MSHTPRLSSGYVFKRYLNAIRPRSSGGPVPPVPDPLYADVLLLLSLDEDGETFTDFGPLANPITAFDPDVTITQDNTVPLFGGNMGHVIRNGALINQGFLYAVNNASAIGAGDPLCIEYWFAQTVYSNFTSSPVHHRWAGYSGVPDGSQIWSLTNGGNGNIAYRETGLPDEEVPFSLIDLHYTAMQFVPGDAAIYCSLDGVLVQTIAGAAMIPRGGWEQRVFSEAVGPVGINVYEMWIGQFRVTRANRYGNAAAPIPIGPWAKS